MKVFFMRLTPFIKLDLTGKVTLFGRHPQQVCANWGLALCTTFANIHYLYRLKIFAPVLFTPQVNLYPLMARLRAAKPYIFQISRRQEELETTHSRLCSSLFRAMLLTSKTRALSKIVMTFVLQCFRPHVMIPYPKLLPTMISEVNISSVVGANCVAVMSVYDGTYDA